MAMRASKNNAKGTSGQSYVKARFEELGWSAVLNPEHDLGTDIYAGARDAREFDLGALIGVQVKNWAFPFDKPEVNDGVEGWSFSDSADHFDYWLGHRLPHIIALYDKESGRIHWVHVTKKAVVSTGKRRKIFVPKGQVLDEAHLKSLVEIAISNPPGSTWEGSAWVPGQVVPDESQWRYAMIAPRLIAPHPNAPTETASAAQAMSMVTALRLDDIQGEYKKKQPLLDRVLSTANDDLGWNLFAATLTWIQDGQIGDIQKLDASDAAPHLRAACVVAQGAALFEEGKVREAGGLLQRSIDEHDDYNPVDHAWISLHLARNLVQQGQLLRARELALEVAPIGQIAFGDPTAKFMSGVASDMIFSLSGWGAGDLASTIQARDTAVSWWRSQSMTQGLAKHLEQSFKTWANDQAVTWGGSDSTWLRLRSAALISGFAADTPNWAYASSLLSQHMLMLEMSTDQVVSALDLLRLSGSNKEVKLAVNRILERGPVDALIEITGQIDLAAFTRISLYCDLEIIGLAGSLLAPEVADVTANWILSEMKNPVERAKSFGLHFLYADHLVKTLSRIYISCTAEVQFRLREHVVSLPVVEDQSVAHGYAVLMNNIEDWQWSQDQMEQIASRPEGDNFELKDKFNSLVASRDPEFRASLASQIEEGNVSALASWGNVRDLPEVAARGMVNYTTKALAKDLESARKGIFGFSGTSLLHRLVLLNVWHPESAEWESCVEAIVDRSSSPNDLAPGLQLMTLHSDKLPAEVVEKLRAPLLELSSSPPDDRFEFSIFSNADVRADALLLFASLFPSELPEGILLDWLAGNARQIEAAVRVYARTQDPSALPLFASLANHDDSEVRAAVVTVLADWVARGVGGDATSKLLGKLLDEPGVKLALSVTRAISQQSESSDSSEEILNLLQGHDSSVVRRHVAIIRERWLEEG